MDTHSRRLEELLEPSTESIIRRVVSSQQNLFSQGNSLKGPFRLGVEFELELLRVGFKEEEKVWKELENVCLGLRAVEHVSEFLRVGQNGAVLVNQNAGTVYKQDVRVDVYIFPRMVPMVFDLQLTQVQVPIDVFETNSVVNGTATAEGYLSFEGLLVFFEDGLRKQYFEVFIDHTLVFDFEEVAEIPAHLIND